MNVQFVVRSLFWMVMVLLVSKQAQGQCGGTLWTEDFTYSDGTTTGGNNNTANPSADWTSGGCITCDGSSDTWDIRSNQFLAHDVNDHECWLLTESIDISSYTTVDFCVTITEVGDHEGLYMNADDCGDVTNQDYVDIEYQIDGGGWTLIPNYLGWCGLYSSCANHTFFGDDGLGQGDCRNSDTDWGTSTVSITGLSGTSLEIRITARNSAGSEYIYIDNLSVSGNIPLPVELTSFSAEPDGEDVLLTWSTASELNNDFFSIERSADGVSFSEIATISGHGTTNGFSFYRQVDFDPLKGTSYYRLKQVDMDGSEKYSRVRSVNMESSFPIELDWASYSQGKLTVQLTNKPEGTYFLKLYSINGQKLMDRVGSDQRLSIDMPNLSSGLYMVRLNAQAGGNTLKIMVP